MVANFTNPRFCSSGIKKPSDIGHENAENGWLKFIKFHIVTISIPKQMARFTDPLFCSSRLPVFILTQQKPPAPDAKRPMTGGNISKYIYTPLKISKSRP